MTPIHVVGIGLEGLAGLGETVQEIIRTATLLVGSDRHLQLIPHGDARRLSLRDFNASFKAIQTHLATTPNPQVVILTSGDPLFYGLGRWLLEVFTPDQLTFHPHLSAVQLAFSRLKLPWQDAVIYSAHGRDLAGLVPLLQRGWRKLPSIPMVRLILLPLAAYTKHCTCLCPIGRGCVRPWVVQTKPFCRGT